MSSKCFVTADDYKRYWPKPEAVIVEMADHHGWPPSEMVAIFTRLLDDACLNHESPEMIARWQEKLDHWTKVKQMDDEVQAQGWAAVKQLTGEEE